MSELYQLSVYIPEDTLEPVKDALFEAGGGTIGCYDRCCWQTLGQGQFRPRPGSQPYIGESDKVSMVAEYLVMLVVRKAQLPDVIDALLRTHPYETPAYSYYPIATGHPQ